MADPQTVNKTLRTGLKISDRYRDRDLRATVEKLFFVFFPVRSAPLSKRSLFFVQANNEESTSACTFVCDEQPRTTKKIAMEA